MKDWYFAHNFVLYVSARSRYQNVITLLYYSEFTKTEREYIEDYLIHKKTYQQIADNRGITKSAVSYVINRFYDKFTSLYDALDHSNCYQTRNSFINIINGGPAL